MRTLITALVATALTVIPVIPASAAEPAPGVVAGQVGDYYFFQDGKKTPYDAGQAQLVGSSLDGRAVVLGYGQVIREYQVLAPGFAYQTTGAWSSPEVSPNGRWAVTVDNLGARRIDLTSGQAVTLPGGANPRKVGVNDQGQTLVLLESGVARVCQDTCKLVTWTYPAVPGRLLLTNDGKYAITQQAGRGGVGTLATWNLSNGDWEGNYLNGATVDALSLDGNKVIYARGGELSQTAAPGQVYSTPTTLGNYQGIAAAIMKDAPAFTAPAVTTQPVKVRILIARAFGEDVKTKGNKIFVKRNECVFPLATVTRIPDTGNNADTAAKMSSGAVKMQELRNGTWVDIPMSESSKCWFGHNTQIRAVYTGEITALAKTSPIRVVVAGK